jgi:hypothetical protein
VASRPSIRRLRPSLTAVLGSIGTVVGLVSGIVGLVAFVKPDLAPKPKLPISRAAAALHEIALEPNVSREQYLDRIDRPPTGFTEEQLARRGVFVRFHVALDGFRGVPITLRRELVDARTGDELGETSAITITPPKDAIARDWHDWIDLTGRRGRYFVIVKLHAPDEVAPLATLQTKPFDRAS